MRLLYVDDDPDLRDLAEMALGLDPSVTVRTAASGAEALESVRSAPPDVVLLDVMMPEMDGPAVLRALRADATLQAIEVVFVTARALPEEQQKLLDLGAAGVITKPFDPLKLAGDVRAVLGRGDG